MQLLGNILLVDIIFFIYCSGHLSEDFLIKGPTSKATVYGSDGSRLITVSNAGSISPNGNVGPTFLSYVIGPKGNVLESNGNDKTTENHIGDEVALATQNNPLSVLSQASQSKDCNNDTSYKQEKNVDFYSINSVPTRDTVGAASYNQLDIRTHGFPEHSLSNCHNCATPTSKHSAFDNEGSSLIKATFAGGIVSTDQNDVSRTQSSFGKNIDYEGQPSSLPVTIIGPSSTTVIARTQSERHNGHQNPSSVNIRGPHSSTTIKEFGPNSKKYQQSGSFTSGISSEPSHVRNSYNGIQPTSNVPLNQGYHATTLVTAVRSNPPGQDNIRTSVFGAGNININPSKPSTVNIIGPSSTTTFETSAPHSKGYHQSDSTTSDNINQSKSSTANIIGPSSTTTFETSAPHTNGYHQLDSTTSVVFNKLQHTKIGLPVFDSESHHSKQISSPDITQTGTTFTSIRADHGKLDSPSSSNGHQPKSPIITIKEPSTSSIFETSPAANQEYQQLGSFTSATYNQPHYVGAPSLPNSNTNANQPSSLAPVTIMGPSSTTVIAHSDDRSHKYHETPSSVNIRGSTTISKEFGPNSQKYQQFGLFTSGTPSQSAEVIDIYKENQPKSNVHVHQGHYEATSVNLGSSNQPSQDNVRSFVYGPGNNNINPSKPSTVNIIGPSSSTTFETSVLQSKRYPQSDSTTSTIFSKSQHTKIGLPVFDSENHYGKQTSYSDITQTRPTLTTTRTDHGLSNEHQPRSSTVTIKEPSTSTLFKTSPTATQEYHQLGSFAPATSYQPHYVGVPSSSDSNINSNRLKSSTVTIVGPSSSTVLKTSAPSNQEYYQTNHEQHESASFVAPSDTQSTDSFQKDIEVNSHFASTNLNPISFPGEFSSSITGTMIKRPKPATFNENGDISTNNNYKHYNIPFGPNDSQTNNHNGISHTLLKSHEVVNQYPISSSSRDSEIRIAGPSTSTVIGGADANTIFSEGRVTNQPIEYKKLIIDHHGKPLSFGTDTSTKPYVPSANHNTKNTFSENNQNKVYHAPPNQEYYKSSSIASMSYTTNHNLQKPCTSENCESTSGYVGPEIITNGKPTYSGHILNAENKYISHNMEKPRTNYGDTRLQGYSESSSFAPPTFNNPDYVSNMANYGENGAVNSADCYYFVLPTYANINPGEYAIYFKKVTHSKSQ